jgi:class 3 adenylate cyclase
MGGVSVRNLLPASQNLTQNSKRFFVAAHDFKRKLAAILHADVKGYSRLMGEDEEATVSTLTTCMEIMNVLILTRHSRNQKGVKRLCHD